MKQLSVFVVTEVLAIAVIIYAIVALTEMDREDRRIHNKIYCNNVDLFKQSKGEFGHPDYYNIYFKYCEGEISND